MSHGLPLASQRFVTLALPPLDLTPPTSGGSPVAVLYYAHKFLGKALWNAVTARSRVAGESDPPVTIVYELPSCVTPPRSHSPVLVRFHSGPRHYPRLACSSVGSFDLHHCRSPSSKIISPKRQNSAELTDLSTNASSSRHSPPAIFICFRRWFVSPTSQNHRVVQSSCCQAPVPSPAARTIRFPFFHISIFQLVSVCLCFLVFPVFLLSTYPLFHSGLQDGFSSDRSRPRSSGQTSSDFASCPIDCRTVVGNILLVNYVNRMKTPSTVERLGVPNPLRSIRCCPCI